MKPSCPDFCKGHLTKMPLPKMMDTDIVVALRRLSRTIYPMEKIGRTCIRFSLVLLGAAFGFWILRDPYNLVSTTTGQTGGLFFAGVWFVLLLPGTIALANDWGRWGSLMLSGVLGGCFASSGAMVGSYFSDSGITPSTSWTTALWLALFVWLLTIGGKVSTTACLSVIRTRIAKLQECRYRLSILNGALPNALLS